MAAARRAFVFDDILDSIVAEVVASIPEHRPKRQRRCLCGCGEMFAPKTDARVYFSKACGRRAHYLRFNVREMRKAKRRRAA